MGATLYNTAALSQSGLGLTGKARKNSEPARIATELKDKIRHQLREVDQQNAINSFTWYNLPDGINGELVERILYYRGQAILFKLYGKFYFLPFTPIGAPDWYGRFTGCSPLPFNGTTSKPDEKPIIDGAVYKPIYAPQLPDNFVNADGTIKTEELKAIIEDGCVIFNDYSPQCSFKITARQLLQDPLLDVMAECIPFMRTNLLNSTGIQGVRIGDTSEYRSVLDANDKLENAALTGDRYIPITAKIALQELAGGQVAKSEEYMLAMQSLDNYRLGLHGLGSGGVFQKKSHMLESEQQSNMGNIGLILRDRTQNRQNSCDIANSIWGTQIWCEPSEVLTNVDINGDGILGSDEEEQGTEMTNVREEFSNE